MSISSKRGKDFELLIARVVRQKGFKVYRDKRSGAGINKSDLSDWTRELPLFIECKDHKAIQIKTWFTQVKNTAKGIPPAVVFHADEEILVTLRFDDLLNFLVENKDLTNQLKDFRQNIAEFQACPNHHIADEHGYCEQKNCKYRRGAR